ncbi:unnamed protein product [Protopolystoma xenopodis]|uniref:Uncharacterized protein n=1 Tax=Protopolystoma xenopodis TaxID=117903 RepID=A0A3S5CHJ9_9PLAT|nr:unnamed protein product [Protopolystoma xenopodis]
MAQIDPYFIESHLLQMLLGLYSSSNSAYLVPISPLSYISSSLSPTEVSSTSPPLAPDPEVAIQSIRITSPSDTLSSSEPTTLTAHSTQIPSIDVALIHAALDMIWTCLQELRYWKYYLSSSFSSVTVVIYCYDTRISMSAFDRHTCTEGELDESGRGKQTLSQGHRAPCGRHRDKWQAPGSPDVEN